MTASSVDAGIDEDSLELFLDLYTRGLDGRANQGVLAADTDTLARCAEAGVFTPDGGPPAEIWADRRVRHRLLVATAIRSPALALVLAAAATLPESGSIWVYLARPAATGWTLTVPGQMPVAGPLVFRHEGRILRAAGDGTSAQALVSGVHRLGWTVQVDEAVPAGIDPSDLLAPPDLDLAAVLAGCLRRAWRQARDHAETRPMFKRHLADFEDIRYRLIRLSAALSDAEALAGDADGRSLAALTALADEARDELQQIAGGTGYMADSAFAESVWWLDWLDRALRAGPGIATGAG